MNCVVIPGRRTCIVCLFLTLAVCVVPKAAADNPKSSGAIVFSDQTLQVATFTLEGTDRHIGRFTSSGELDYVPGAQQGILEGTGVVVLTAANGDQLVGVATSEFDTASLQGNFHFSWRDSVTLRDGTVVSNSGRFAKHRPPGLVVVYSGTDIKTNIIVTILIIILRG
jgi:hypothetical protein